VIGEKIIRVTHIKLCNWKNMASPNEENLYINIIMSHVLSSAYFTPLSNKIFICKKKFN